MWLLIYFGLGIIAFLTFMCVSKLYKFKETKLRTRVNYSLGLSLFFIFFTLFFLWQTDGDVIGKGLLLGAVLCVPLCFYSKRWIEKRIEGTTTFYKRKQYFRRLLWVIPMSILFFIFFSYADFGRKIIEAVWPLLGFCFAWFTSEVFILLYVVKLERKLSSPILEDQK